MHLSRKYRPLAICTSACLVLFLVHFMIFYFIVYGPSIEYPYKPRMPEQKRGEPTQPVFTTSQRTPCNGTGFLKCTAGYKVSQVRREANKSTTPLKEEPIDMTFYDDPFNWECGPNAKLLRSVEYMECIEENPIFFVETSETRRLNARVSCAIESAAIHHPDRQVRVLSLSPEPLDFTDPYTESLTHLENVRLLRVDLGVLFRGMPLLHWYKKGKWKNSPYKISHTSDAMRLFLVWRYGGMYLDSDIVVLRSLSHLHNTTTTDNGKNLGFALIAFDPDHPLFRESIKDFAANYAPYEFAANGPQLFNRNFKKRCHVDVVDELYIGGENKCDVEVLPQEAAYPIPYKTWQEYFKPQATHNETAFESSLIIHVWNMLSNGGKVVAGQNSLYEMAMKEHCPKVYEQIVKVGYA